MANPHPSTKRYPPELKQRAVRMVRQLRAETGQEHGTIQRVAEQLGCGVESLRTWVKQAGIDAGEVPGMTTADVEELKALRQEVRELRRANEILGRASLCRPPGARETGRRDLIGAWSHLDSGVSTDRPAHPREATQGGMTMVTIGVDSHKRTPTPGAG